MRIAKGKQSYNILTFVCNSPYRGHQPCPCGSKRKLRNCHGKKILTVYQNPAIMRLIKEDYTNIIKYVKQQAAESKSIHSKILKKSMHLI
ncbi:MAG: SEC-C domain-containing protein [Clostridia bacterium]|nr:SEC-C domain-containing protein [Clostridia bacterium]MBR7111580.1 SEC-C domain-containing protein [Clostridia bacterium]